jgi:hypothetical protein
VKAQSWSGSAKGCAEGGKVGGRVGEGDGRTVGRGKGGPETGAVPVEGAGGGWEGRTGMVLVKGGGRTSTVQRLVQQEEVRQLALLQSVDVAQVQ